jgi:hypothetical protein
VELRSQLPRLGVCARSGYGVRRCARVLGAVTASCSADPCPFQNDGLCDVSACAQAHCAFGDYADCHNCGTACAEGGVIGDFVGRSSKSAMLLVNGTLPDTIGSLACRSKITSVYAHPQLVTLSLHAFPPFASSPRVGVDVDNFVRPLARAASVFDSCCRIFDQQPLLVGTVPLTISALTRLSHLYAPAETCFDCFKVHFVCACVCMGESACSRLRLCGLSPMRIGLRNCCGCVIRRLTEARLSGPFPAGITALTMLTNLYAPPCAVRSHATILLSLPTAVRW